MAKKGIHFFFHFIFCKYINLTLRQVENPYLSFFGWNHVFKTGAHWCPVLLYLLQFTLQKKKTGSIFKDSVLLKNIIFSVKVIIQISELPKSDWNIQGNTTNKTKVSFA